MIKRALMLLIAVVSAAPAAARPRDFLRVVVMDVEGGGGTLYVTPEGRSLLVDTGWASTADRPSSAEHIAQTARRLGLKRIDYLIVSHYHADHVGGVAELLRAIPVGTIVDHGPNMEPARAGGSQVDSAAGLFSSYEQAVAGRKRQVVKAGDRLRIGSLNVDIVNAATSVTPAPAMTKGSMASCATAALRPTATVNENDASIGLVTHFGKSRHLNLTDTTVAIEHKLVCPQNKLGAIDLLIVSHHGSAQSNSPQLLEAIQPRVALMGNGATKGGDKAVLQALAAAPSRPDVWQLHKATRSPEADVAEDRIANVQGAPDAHFALEALISPDGRIEIVNQRTGVRRGYVKR